MSNKVNKVKDDVLSGELLPLIYPKKTTKFVFKKVQKQEECFYQGKKKRILS